MRPYAGRGSFNNQGRGTPRGGGDGGSNGAKVIGRGGYGNGTGNKDVWLSQ